MPAKKPSKKPAKKAPAKKAPAKKPPAKKPPAKKAPKTSAARATRTAKRATAAAEKAPAKRPSARADFGMPIDGFFAKKTGELGAIAKALRAMIEAAAPDAEASLKWGMPFFTIGKTPMCAIGVHAAHVNLILSGPASAYPDPDALLRGVGATGRHLKLTRLADLPQKTVSTWLSAAAKHARGA